MSSKLYFHRSVAHVTFLYDRFCFFYFSHSLSLWLSPCAVCVCERAHLHFEPLCTALSSLLLPSKNNSNRTERTTKRAAMEVCKKNKPRWGPPWATLPRCWSVQWFYNFKAAGLLLLDWNSTRNALQELSYICRLGR